MSEFNQSMPKKPCFGSHNPKPRERSGPPLELVLTGPKRRCGASGLLVRQCTNRARSYRRQVCGHA